MLAFIPLTFSVFWGSLAYTLIGGTAVGTVLTLIFLPALYSIWFKTRPTDYSIGRSVTVPLTVRYGNRRSQASVMAD